MSAQTKNSWAATRLPCLGAICAGLNAKTHAPGQSYFETFPFLITVLAAFITLSGIVLSVYYNPWHAFDSVQFIIRNVNHGWLIRTYHATGTTLIFALTYLYLFRTILTRRYRAPAEFVWLISVKLLLVLLLTGWLGFVLTGGAAGYWSLFNATNASLTLGGMPGSVALWFFGGPAGGGTLARLTVFHVLLGASLLLVLWVLHESRKAIAPAAPARAVAFYPYYVAQYFAALAVLGFVFVVIGFYAPHLGSVAANRIPAEAMAVPLDAGVPWYLAPAAGLLNVFPTPRLAVLGAIAAAVTLYALPWLDRSGPNGAKGRLYAILNWVLALDVLGLGFAAGPGCPVASTLAGLFTFWYFFHFLVLTPVVTAMEAK
jgi:quinol-cytochrome oxidoreductase complex cytochrome b subunit